MVDSQLQEIKDRLDIVEVLSGYLRLSKAGRNFKAPCPFHNEKTPSFVISPERQIWHCFGCGQGGDIFTFVMKMEGMEFPEALRHLAEKAGVELKRINYEAAGAKTKILEVNRVAKNFYREQLARTEAGLAAKKYLLGRGLTEESINNFEIGYAPDAWSDTENFLVARGFTKKEIFSAGITVARDRGSSFSSGGNSENFYDRFRGRIMFPILDITGRTVGFGGRSFTRKDGQEAKYINSPESLTYSKSRILYGMNFARERIRKTNNCILVEGYMDVIGSHQMGVTNAVASSGTALTSEQLKLIKRYASRLILSFDGDDAGQEATRRSIDLAVGAGFGVKIVVLPAEKDPSDFVDNPDGWKKLVKEAIDINDFYFKNSFSKNNANTLEGKKAIADELLGEIAKIPSSIEQAHWVGILSDKIDIDEKVLLEELKKIRLGNKSAPSASGRAAGSGFLVKNSEELEGYLLALMILPPDIAGQIKKIKEYGFVFNNSDWRKIYETAASYGEERLQKADLMLDLKKILAPELFQNLSEIALKAEYYYEIGSEPGKTNKVFEELLKRLVSKQYEAKQKILEKDIKTAEANKDHESIKLFMKELADISQKKEKLTK
ncbi:MAG: DNA primase [bacterium]|nr:DNA primase [bacterium]